MSLTTHDRPDENSLIETVTGVSEILRNSLTCDQRSEVTRHQFLSLKTDLDVHFTHPHSPWERGTNENTNRLLREHFLKSAKRAPTSPVPPPT